MMRVLRAHGHVGPSTVGAPRPGLREDLMAMRDRGGPALGAGVGPSMPGQGSDAQGAPDHGQRWDSQLPPELPRGAPEIYRSLRAESSVNVRDWLSQNYPGQKDAKNSEWIDLWQSATEIDFEVDHTPIAQVPSMLAASDGMEIKLRRLAAFEHFWRTHDQSAMLRMLAIRPPGVSGDIAPAWMLKDAIDHSKCDYQQQQRVQGRGRGRGGFQGGGGQGGGRGAQGRGRGQAAAGGGQAGGADRGRGRGRGQA